MFHYKYARPALTVDCVVFGINDGDLQVLLIERAHAPFAGAWALPGGFVDMDETTEDAARRELAEETGLTDVFLEQLYTFSAVDRDGLCLFLAHYVSPCLSYAAHGTPSAVVGLAIASI